MLSVFVGYDEREDAAYRVTEASLRRHASQPLTILPLAHRDLRRQGLFDRPWRIDQQGQYWDERDGRPFSTQFAHSRFLVPHLARRLGIVSGWALFCDCDFLFLADVAALFALADRRYAAMVVKHGGDTGHVPAETAKMDGVVQALYARKNWSSLVMWNLDHEANHRLGIDQVNGALGGWLHGFGWLSDHEIGALPPEWNWLEGSAPLPAGAHPKAVHHTRGAPCFKGYERVAYARAWHHAALEAQAAALAETARALAELDPDTHPVNPARAARQGD